MYFMYKKSSEYFFGSKLLFVCPHNSKTDVEILLIWSNKISVISIKIKITKSNYEKENIFFRQKSFPFGKKYFPNAKRF